MLQSGPIATTRTPLKPCSPQPSVPLSSLTSKPTVRAVPAGISAGALPNLAFAQTPYLLIYDAVLNPPMIVRVVHQFRDLPAALDECSGTQRTVQHHDRMRRAPAREVRDLVPA